jgi:hypothetical protein
MRRLARTLTVCGVLSVCLLPVTGLAGGRHSVQRGFPGRSGVPVHGGGFRAVPEFRPKGAFGSPGGFPFPAQPAHHGRANHEFFGHKFPRRTFFPWSPSTVFLYTPGAAYDSSLDTASPVVTVSPTIYAAPSIYVSPPIMSSQAAPAPAAPSTESPLPSVVEHPTGRYELRGDGVATPYVWVWIPKPPAEPPAAPPSSPEEPRAATSDSASRTKTYRWTDEEGTTFFTNRLERIPDPYRSRVEETGQ